MAPLDDWMRRALRVIENSDVSNQASLAAIYVGLPQPMRRGLLRCCPFRLMVLQALRAMAESSASPIRSSGKSQKCIQNDRAKLRYMLDFTRQMAAWDDSEFEPRFFHTKQYTVVTRNDAEARFFEKLLDDDTVSDVVQKALEEYCSGQVSNVAAHFGGFEDLQTDELNTILANLRHLPTRLIQSLTQHVSLIFFATYPTDTTSSEHGLISAHHPLLPNSFFLSRIAFSERGHLLELMYHESLHNELETISLVRSFYKADIDPLSTPKFVRPWGDAPTDNLWTFDRAFHAHYVYFHLCDLMRFLMHSRTISDDLRLWGRHRYAICRERGLELAQWLLVNGPHVLSAAGVKLVRFSRNMLTAQERRRRPRELISLPDIAH